ncbi:hypothetical protein [Qipengyuania aquimaris]|uniref:Uncharacterized protein n=1 Tax=Qipengyuania aquimaris TaxID=255984 RepID=A0A9Q3S077_9SPHN|nr:hypothetical protein [Qipengyuania aquimaris]MBY6217572.1 hypothetical protein [Qipengyuania aquimaris]
MGFGRKGLASGEIATGPAGMQQGFGQTPRQNLAAAPPAAGARQFDVTPNPLLMLFCLLFFGAVAAYLAYEVNDPRGLILNGIIELGPFGADIFFGVLALSAAGWALIGGAGFITSLSGKSYLRLDANAVESTSGVISRTPTRIQYALIKDIKLDEYQGKFSVEIVDRGGEKICAASQNFKSHDEFEEFLELLNERMAAVRR